MSSAFSPKSRYYDFALVHGNLAVEEIPHTVSHTSTVSRIACFVSLDPIPSVKFCRAPSLHPFYFVPYSSYRTVMRLVEELEDAA